LPGNGRGSQMNFRQNQDQALNWGPPWLFYTRFRLSPGLPRPLHRSSPSATREESPGGGPTWGRSRRSL